MGVVHVVAGDEGVSRPRASAIRCRCYSRCPRGFRSSSSFSAADGEPTHLHAAVFDSSSFVTKGCPSTLGANRKSQDFVEKVSAREEYVKAFFTEKVIQEIEKDIGCKLIVEEKFIVVSGKDRLILSKGTNAVRKVKEEAERKHYDSQMRRSISPEKSSVGPQYGCSDSQGSYPSPRNTSQFQQGFGRHDKAVEDIVREDFREMARASSRVRGEAFAYDGARNCSRHLMSPTHPSQRGSSCTLYEGHRHRQNMEHYITDGWDAERQRCDKYSGRDSVHPAAATPIEEREEASKRSRLQTKRGGREEVKEDCGGCPPSASLARAPQIRRRRYVGYLNQGSRMRLTAGRWNVLSRWLILPAFSLELVINQLNANMSTNRSREAHHKSCQFEGSRMRLTAGRWNVLSRWLILPAFSLELVINQLNANMSTNRSREAHHKSCQFEEVR